MELFSIGKNRNIFDHREKIVTAKTFTYSKKTELFGKVKNRKSFAYYEKSKGSLQMETAKSVEQ